jgi:hypothetical protein
MLFQGGVCTMNQGGVGPDKYLFRLNKGGTHGRFHLITIRTEPYWYEQDLKALSFLLRNSDRRDYQELNRRYVAEKFSHEITAQEFVYKFAEGESNYRMWEHEYRWDKEQKTWVKRIK